MNQQPVAEEGLVGAENHPEQDVAAMATRALEAVEEFVQEQPHAAIGLAAAAGFILGGGLTPRRLFRLGFAMGGPTLTRRIATEAFRIAQERLEGGQEERAPKPRHRAKKEPA
ncbi:MAG TPA: hypothetical protein VF881_02875 [Polyangiaceae bacterium]